MTRGELSFSLFLSLACWSAPMVGGLGVSTAYAQATATETGIRSTVGNEISAGTQRQQAWLKASLNQRIKIAEQLGDEGARRLAKSKGWTSLFDGKVRGIPQGPDQVYLADDLIHVVESKGGSSPLGRSYGYVQGSSENTVLSAKRVLASSKASPAQRSAAKAVLEAAANGKMRVHVVRTSHVLGEPTAAVLEQTVTCTDEAARLAQNTLDDIAKGTSQVVDDAARAGKPLLKRGGARLLKVTGKAAIPIAVVVDVGLRVHKGSETERQFEAGEISSQQREVAHAKNVAGMAGGWGGALAGAKLGALGGGAVGSAFPGPGTAIGGFAGGVTGGVAGYFGGEAAAKATARWTVERVHSAGKTVTGSVKAAWSGTVDITKSAASGVKGAWNWLSQ